MNKILLGISMFFCLCGVVMFSFFLYNETTIPSAVVYFGVSILSFCVGHDAFKGAFNEGA